VALNFIINGKEYVVPMVTEEPSVVAAASNAAKMARPGGGFFAGNTGSIMIAQVQLVGIPNPDYAKIIIYEHKDEIIRICNEKDPTLIKFGGGVQDIDVRVISSRQGDMVVVHLKVNTLDAMGANAVNTMAEAAAPYLESITGGRVYLRSSLIWRCIVWPAPGS
jgi:hydroxymethylglutaryl-CoA reductase